MVGDKGMSRDSLPLCLGVEGCVIMTVAIATESAGIAGVARVAGTVPPIVTVGAGC